MTRPTKAGHTTGRTTHGSRPHITSVHLQGINNDETVPARRAPIIPVSTSPRL
jgi:hypothetical protein